MDEALPVSRAGGDDVFYADVARDGGEMTVEMIPYLDLPAVEGLQVAEDLAGHWTITIDGFWSSFDPTGVGFGQDLGPWVLEFDVPADS